MGKDGSGVRGNGDTYEEHERSAGGGIGAQLGIKEEINFNCDVGGDFCTCLGGVGIGGAEARLICRTLVSIASQSLTTWEGK